MRRMFMLAVAASGTVSIMLAACARTRDTGAARPPAPTEVGEAPTARPGEPVPGAAQARSPDAPLRAPVIVDVNALAFGPGPESLPKGAEVAVLEGTPPFDREQSYMIALRLPRNYTIPPHQHLVTERVTVLRGRPQLGHGTQVDRRAAKALAPGGLVLMPSDHTHYALTTDEETIVVLGGVGPWNIYYANPENDPRPTPAVMQRGFVSRFDAPVRMTVVNANEIGFTAAPAGMLPPGAQIAILDGDPQQRQNFVMRVRVPDGYTIPAHTHDITDRVIVLSGRLVLDVLEPGQSPARHELAPGSIAILPAGTRHAATARGETVFQVMGTGPYRMRWERPEDEPRAPAQARRRD